MLRRSISELSARRGIRRIPSRIITQLPSYVSSRKEFSAAVQQNEPQGSGPAVKSFKSGTLPKIVIGSVALGAAAAAAYKTGYLDDVLTKKPPNEPEENVTVETLKERNKNITGDVQLGERIVESSSQQSIVVSPDVGSAEKNVETHPDHTQPEEMNKDHGENKFEVKDTPVLTPPADGTLSQEEELPSPSQSNMLSDYETTKSTILPDKSIDSTVPEDKSNMEPHKAPEIPPILPQADDVTISEENEMKSTSPQHLTNGIPEYRHDDNMKQSTPLLDEYYLRDKAGEASAASPEKHKDLVAAVEDMGDAYMSEDGKLVLDFLLAIHTAEKRQAELDARIFAEEKKAMKEKYEKELRDARARELMYAEREAILDKELNKERMKSTAALKALQEKYEVELKVKLEQKEAEAESQLQKIQELAKAEFSAAIASEKTAQIEKMAEANLNISALCMAFYARSEEARQSHSVHKLALAAVALEDALSKGLPIQKEIEALRIYLEGVDRDSLLDLVLSSLPEETRLLGTDTQMQLNHKFDALKGTLRHFSLIPPGGGGILAHSLAHVASWLKVKEVDQTGDGIESLINRVEHFLAEGKLSEAADALENGVQGSQAAEIVGDWVKRARSRAITEQALILIHSYATAISIT